MFNDFIMATSAEKKNKIDKISKKNQKIIKTKSYIQKTIFQVINPNHEQIIIKKLRKRKMLKKLFF